ncbi:MAG TPA: serine/threonine-protein kinase [Tenuifilaceae bacterium]|nr:serine/threonine-protein kinase [Tenuifilaceae bacterium]HPI44625.1 serine/threonine-protein kinase [Tenuifilaceae bacterium]HPN20284.1 serine/threonine-protein kinase [Tenuifilaceae bacterium]
MPKDFEDILLIGPHDKYVLTLSNPKNILKANGEICCTFIGTRQRNGQKVIVKRFHRYLNNNPRYCFRAEREYEGLSKCTRQNPELIIQDDTKYLVRDFTEGIDLQKIITGKYKAKITVQQKILIVIEALKALKRIHDAGFVHCDIKPGNIIVRKVDDVINFDNPQVDIIDFGLIRKPSEPLCNKGDKLPFSLIYSSPEQILNLWELIQPQTDIYAMGVTLWQLLTCKNPWESSNPLMRIQLQLVVPLPQHKSISDFVFEVVAKATSKARLPKPPRFYSHNQLLEFEQEAIVNRYTSADEMINALENLDLSMLQKKKSFWRMFS